MPNNSNYGWAYIHPEYGQGQARGPVYSLQFQTNNNGGPDNNGIGQISGSSTLAYNPTTLTLTSGHILPAADCADNATYNLGSSTKRWANVYTCDLHLKNERGDWTIVEEEDYLSVINNKTGKKYKMMLEEIVD